MIKEIKILSCIKKRAGIKTYFPRIARPKAGPAFSWVRGRPCSNHHVRLGSDQSQHLTVRAHERLLDRGLPGFVQHGPRAGLEEHLHGASAARADLIQGRAVSCPPKDLNTVHKYMFKRTFALRSTSYRHVKSRISGVVGRPRLYSFFEQGFDATEISCHCCLVQSSRPVLC